MKEGHYRKIPKKDTRFEYKNWRGACVLPVDANMLTKIIPEHIKEHLQNTERANYPLNPFVATILSPKRSL